MDPLSLQRGDIGTSQGRSQERLVPLAEPLEGIQQPLDGLLRVTTPNGGGDKVHHHLQELRPSLELDKLPVCLDMGLAGDYGVQNDRVLSSVQVKFVRDVNAVLARDEEGLHGFEMRSLLLVRYGVHYEQRLLGLFLLFGGDVLLCHCGDGEDGGVAPQGLVRGRGAGLVGGGATGGDRFVVLLLLVSAVVLGDRTDCCRHRLQEEGLGTVAEGREESLVALGDKHL